METQYRFSADVTEIDRAQVHAWISEESYWAPGRPRARQDAAIDASLNFGVYDAGSGRQVAYARVITDGVTFAWLCDVFVDPRLRGRGIGRLLVAGVLRECEPLGLRRIALSTQDAHGLYATQGFSPLLVPETWMERPANPRS